MDTKTNELAPAVPGLFTLPPDGGPYPQLLGGYCPGCERYAFPRRPYCANCLGRTEQRVVGSGGSINSYTVVRIKPPLGFPSPYGVVYVDLTESGLRVFGLFDPDTLAQLRIGLEVKLAAGPFGHDGQGNVRLRPIF